MPGRVNLAIFTFLLGVTVLLGVSVCFSSYAQQTLVDSIEPKLTQLNHQERIDVLNRLADTFLKDSVALSLSYQLQAYKASQKLGDAKKIIIQAEKVADLYTHLGQYKKALEYYNIALNYGKRINDYSSLSKTLRFIGNAYYYMGEYDKCLESHLQSLDYAKQANNEHGIAAAYNNIGLIHMKRNNYDLALESYQKAEKAFAKLENKSNQGKALINIGNIYFFKNELHNALGYYQLALNVIDKNKNPSDVALASQNLSIVYEELEDFDNALEFAKLAYSLYYEDNDIWGLANITHNIGYLFISRKEYEVAEKYFLESLSYSKKTNSLPTLSKSLAALSTLYDTIGDYEKAYRFLKEENQVVDSIYRMETEKKVSELEAKHELDKKRKEHRLLQTFFVLMSVLAVLVVLVLLFNYRLKVRANNQLKEKNIKIEEQNVELAEINATKDKFFSIIAHDLKNPLAAFVGFMEVFQDKLSDMPHEEQQYNLKQVTLLAENMLDLLENLLKWGRSQVGAIEFKPQKLWLNELVDQTIELVSWNAVAKSIKINNNVDKNLTVIGDQNMLLTVIRNLVSNAIKFSYKGGKVEISSDKKDDSISLLVKDNGIGISPDDQAKLFRIDSEFKSKGTENESGTGLGLVICKEFISYHKGKMIVHSKEGKGSIFGFTIKDYNLNA